MEKVVKITEMLETITLGENELNENLLNMLLAGVDTGGATTAILLPKEHFELPTGNCTTAEMTWEPKHHCVLMKNDEWFVVKALNPEISPILLYFQGEFITLKEGSIIYLNDGSSTVESQALLGKTEGIVVEGDKLQRLEHAVNSDFLICENGQAKLTSLSEMGEGKLPNVLKCDVNLRSMGSGYFEPPQLDSQSSSTPFMVEVNEQRVPLIVYKKDNKLSVVEPEKGWFVFSNTQSGSYFKLLIRDGEEVKGPYCQAYIAVTEDMVLASFPSIPLENGTHTTKHGAICVIKKEVKEWHTSDNAQGTIVLWDGIPVEADGVVPVGSCALMRVEKQKLVYVNDNQLPLLMKCGDDRLQLKKGERVPGFEIKFTGSYGAKVDLTPVGLYFLDGVLSKEDQHILKKEVDAKRGDAFLIVCSSLSTRIKVLGDDKELKDFEKAPGYPTLVHLTGGRLYLVEIGKSLESLTERLPFDLRYGVNRDIATDDDVRCLIVKDGIIDTPYTIAERLPFAVVDNMTIVGNSIISDCNMGEIVESAKAEGATPFVIMSEGNTRILMDSLQEFFLRPDGDSYTRTPSESNELIRYRGMDAIVGVSKGDDVMSFVVNGKVFIVEDTVFGPTITKKEFKSPEI